MCISRCLFGIKSTLWRVISALSATNKRIMLKLEHLTRDFAITVLRAAMRPIVAKLWVIIETTVLHLFCHSVITHPLHVPSHVNRHSWTDSSNFSWPVCSRILSLRTISFHETFRILLSHLWCAASRRWVSVLGQRPGFGTGKMFKLTALLLTINKRQSKISCKSSLPLTSNGNSLLQ